MKVARPDPSDDDRKTAALALIELNGNGKTAEPPLGTVERNIIPALSSARKSFERAELNSKMDGLLVDLEGNAFDASYSECADERLEIETAGQPVGIQRNAFDASATKRAVGRLVPYGKTGGQLIDLEGNKFDTSSAKKRTIETSDLSVDADGPLIDLEGNVFEKKTPQKVVERVAHEAEHTKKINNLSRDNPKKKAETTPCDHSNDICITSTETKSPFYRHDYWGRRYEQLVEYNRMWKTCNVAEKYSRSPGLGKWVYTQRLKYKKGMLTKEQFRELDKLGFTFVKMKTWDHHYDLLVKFREECGHTTVPRRSPFTYNGLAEWTFIQRRHRKFGLLPEEHINKLDKIQFQWK